MKQFYQLLGTKNSESKKKTVFDEKTVQFIFQKIVEKKYGMKGRENIRAGEFSKGRLVVVVNKSLWYTEVLLERDSLTMAINQECGDRVVSLLQIKKQ